MGSICAGSSTRHFVGGKSAAVTLFLPLPLPLPAAPAGAPAGGSGRACSLRVSTNSRTLLAGVRPAAACAFITAARPFLPSATSTPSKMIRQSSFWSRPSRAAGMPALRSVTLFCFESPMPKPGLPFRRTTNVSSVGLTSTGRCTTNVCSCRVLSMTAATLDSPPRTSVPSAQHSRSPIRQRLSASGLTSVTMFSSFRPMPRGSGSSMMKILGTMTGTAFSGAGAAEGAPLLLDSLALMPRFIANLQEASRARTARDQFFAFDFERAAIFGRCGVLHPPARRPPRRHKQCCALRAHSSTSLLLIDSLPKSMLTPFAGCSTRCSRT